MQQLIKDLIGIMNVPPSYVPWVTALLVVAGAFLIVTLAALYGGQENTGGDTQPPVNLVHRRVGRDRTKIASDETRGLFFRGIHLPDRWPGVGLVRRRINSRRSITLILGG